MYFPNLQCEYSHLDRGITSYCTLSCHEESKRSQLKNDLYYTLFSFRANVLKVDIFYEELNYEVISEELSYEASDM